MNFHDFKKPIEDHLKEMMNGELFVTDIERDKIWEAYLAAFPEGSNPVFRKRSEHDCSCCRRFVKVMGAVVSIRDGSLVTIWDAPGLSDPKSPILPPYAVVAKRMSDVVRGCRIISPFRHNERRVGNDATPAEVDGGVVTFSHFSCDIPSNRNAGPNFYVDKLRLQSVLGELRTLKEVFERGLRTLTVESLETVLELIANKSLYRGDQYKSLVETFLAAKKEFDSIGRQDQQGLFIWSKVMALPESVARIKNVAIGVLLNDLSEGMDLEKAVKRFETSIMAPENYKRPTALVSKAMVEKARAKVEELGLTSALERRHARLTDISISDVLFVDNSAKGKVLGTVFDDLATKGDRPPRDLSKVETVTMEEFIANILPKASSVEVMVENKMAPNFVSLIAPLYPSSKPMFKWNNRFSWSYAGELADSIKERVKKAGGNVTGDLCCRLAWYNKDDLDLHMYEPKSRGNHIHYASPVSYKTGGMLDVDMNVLYPVRGAVENIFYQDRRKMTEGEYRLVVNQYNRREASLVGFEVEIDFMGDVKRFAYDQEVKGAITVAKFNYSHNGGVEFIETLPERSASKVVWGVKTQEFVKASVIMLSPNFWSDQAIGNKHYFFMLDGCVADEAPRGFYNEFLKGDLEEHRKVLEIVGGKMKVEPDANQLSGLGFSSTKRAEIVVRVKGNINRLLKVTV